LSQAEFCRRERIKESALSYWKRSELRRLGKTTKSTLQKRRRAKSGGVEFAAADDKQPARHSRTEAKPGILRFVPVVASAGDASHKVAREASGSDPIAEISHGQLSIRIWSGADAETLRALLQVLKEYSLC